MPHTLKTTGLWTCAPLLPPMPASAPRANHMQLHASHQSKCVPAELDNPRPYAASLQVACRPARQPGAGTGCQLATVWVEAVGAERVDSSWVACGYAADVPPAARQGRHLVRHLFKAVSRPVLRGALLTPGFVQRFTFRCGHTHHHTLVRLGCMKNLLSAVRQLSNAAVVLGLTTGNERRALPEPPQSAAPPVVSCVTKLGTQQPQGEHTRQLTTRRASFALRQASAAGVAAAELPGHGGALQLQPGGARPLLLRGRAAPPAAAQRLVRRLRHAPGTCLHAPACLQLVQRMTPQHANWIRVQIGGSLCMLACTVKTCSVTVCTPS